MDFPIKIVEGPSIGCNTARLLMQHNNMSKANQYLSEVSYVTRNSREYGIPENLKESKAQKLPKCSNRPEPLKASNNSVWPGMMKTPDDLCRTWGRFHLLPTLLSECLVTYGWQEKYHVLARVFQDACCDGNLYKRKDKFVPKNPDENVLSPKMTFEKFMAVLEKYPCLELVRIRSFFRYLDGNKAGSISDTDFISGMLASSPEAPHIYQSPVSGRFSALTNSSDLNDAREIQISGFADPLNKVPSLTLLRLQLIFLEADTDMDGRLSISELSRLLRQIIGTLENIRRSCLPCTKTNTNASCNEHALGHAFWKVVKDKMNLVAAGFEGETGRHRPEIVDHSNSAHNKTPKMPNQKDNEVDLQWSNLISPAVDQLSQVGSSLSRYLFGAAENRKANGAQSKVEECPIDEEVTPVNNSYRGYPGAICASGGQSLRQKLDDKIQKDKSERGHNLGQNRVSSITHPDLSKPQLQSRNYEINDMRQAEKSLVPHSQRAQGPLIKWPLQSSRHTFPPKGNSGISSFFPSLFDIPTILSRTCSINSGNIHQQGVQNDLLGGFCNFNSENFFAAERSRELVIEDDAFSLTMTSTTSCLEEPGDDLSKPTFLDPSSYYPSLSQSNKSWNQCETPKLAKQRDQVLYPKRPPTSMFQASQLHAASLKEKDSIVHRHIAMSKAKAKLNPNDLSNTVKRKGSNGGIYAGSLPNCSDKPLSQQQNRPDLRDIDPALLTLWRKTLCNEIATAIIRAYEMPENEGFICYAGFLEAAMKNDIPCLDLIFRTKEDLCSTVKRVDAKQPQFTEETAVPFSTASSSTSIDQHIKEKSHENHNEHSNEEKKINPEQEGVASNKKPCIARCVDSQEQAAEDKLMPSHHRENEQGPVENVFVSDAKAIVIESAVKSTQTNRSSLYPQIVSLNSSLSEDPEASLMEDTENQHKFAELCSTSKDPNLFLSSPVLNEMSIGEKSPYPLERSWEQAQIGEASLASGCLTQQMDEKSILISRRVVAAIDTIKMSGWKGPRSILDKEKQEHQHNSDISASVTAAVAQLSLESSSRLLPPSLLEKLCDAVVDLLRWEARIPVIKGNFSVIAQAVTAKDQTNLRGEKYQIYPQLDALAHSNYGKQSTPLSCILLGGFACGTAPEECLELIALVFATKLRYPLHFFPVRGAYEDFFAGVAFGIEDQCQLRYGVERGRKLCRRLFDVMEFLPVCVLVGGLVESKSINDSNRNKAPNSMNLSTSIQCWLPGRTLCIAGDVPSRQHWAELDLFFNSPDVLLPSTSAKLPLPSLLTTLVPTPPGTPRNSKKSVKSRSLNPSSLQKRKQPLTETVFNHRKNCYPVRALEVDQAEKSLSVPRTPNYQPKLLTRRNYQITGRENRGIHAFLGKEEIKYNRNVDPLATAPGDDKILNLEAAFELVWSQDRIGQFNNLELVSWPRELRSNESFFSRNIQCSSRFHAKHRHHFMEKLGIDYIIRPILAANREPFIRLDRRNNIIEQDEKLLGSMTIFVNNFLGLEESDLV